MAQRVEQKTPPFFATFEEYFEYDDAHEGKYEYVSGQILAMAGGSTSHAKIAFNLAFAIGGKLRGTDCQGFSPDLRIGVPGTPLYRYPDLTVVCGPLEYDPRDPSRNTVINPRLILEILSPSTEGEDRGPKFQQYLQLPSLEEYVLVSQVRPRVDSFLRWNDGTWLFSYIDGIDGAALLQSLKMKVPLAEIYHSVIFPPTAPEDLVVERQV